MNRNVPNNSWTTGGPRERARAFEDNGVWVTGTLWSLQPWSPDDIGQIDAPEYMPAGSTIGGDWCRTSLFMREGWRWKT